MEMFNPPHPGLLIADILEHGDLSIGRSVTEVARHLGVTRATLSRVINGRSAISAAMALKLEGAFGVRADLWLGLQLKRDLWLASREKRQKVPSVVLNKAA